MELSNFLARSKNLHDQNQYIVNLQLFIKKSLDLKNYLYSILLLQIFLCLVNQSFSNICLLLKNEVFNYFKLFNLLKDKFYEFLHDLSQKIKIFIYDTFLNSVRPNLYRQDYLR
jgi:hypothetical protein